VASESPRGYVIASIFGGSQDPHGYTGALCDVGNGL
jgi:hypothetical protein